MWSSDEEEERLLSVFTTNYTFKTMRFLMQEPLTSNDLALKLHTFSMQKVHRAIKTLRAAELIRVKEFVYTGKQVKIAVYEPTITSLTINISKETTIVGEITK